MMILVNTVKQYMKQTIAIFSLVLVCLLLQACGPVLLGGAATGAAVINDKRTTGTFVEDEAIELKIRKVLLEDVSLKDITHINATSFNTNVLLTGEAVSEGTRQKVFQIVKNTPKVGHIFNEIAIAAPSALLARSSDTLLTSNVKTRLIADKVVDGSKIKVVTEAGVVYLMGIISRDNGTAAAMIASRASGVQKVVKLFEYVD